VQWLRNVSGPAVHVKWAELLDKLTIAGHSHQSAAELYAEITDHLPLVTEVSSHLICLMFISVLFWLSGISLDVSTLLGKDFAFSL